jgi:peptidoglycan hydrolase-like protein with peptidoglycan-binding domain
MMNKLKNLSNLLSQIGLKTEASSVLDMLPKSNTTDDSIKRIASKSIPTLEELRLMFPQENLSSLPSSTVPTLEEVVKLFTREELTAAYEKNIERKEDETLEDKILYKGERLEKGLKDTQAKSLIEEVQTLLEKHGYTLKGYGIDGDFGNETEKAVLEFQSNNKSSGLIESGKIDGATLLALRSMTAVRRSAEKPAPHSDEPKDTSNTGRDFGKFIRNIRAVPSRMKLVNMSPKTKERLYKLTQAEVGSQGARAQQAFMETVVNRASIQGKSIDYTVSDHRYYEPINTKGNGNVDNLRPVSNNAKAKYDKILDKVIEGSNITNGATHNASAGVAKNWESKYDGQAGTRRDIGGETFYSKTYEQKKLKNLDLPNRSTKPSDIPPARRPSLSGEYTLPKVSLVSVPNVSAANLAVKESKEQWDNGNFGEKDPRAEPLIQKYFGWTSRNSSWARNVDRWGPGRRTFGKHKGKRQMNPIVERNKKGVAKFHAWSAAYVSWVMGQYDGEGAKWYVLEGHSGYIRAFKNKRRKIEKNPEEHIGKMYYLWFTREEMNKYGMKPELGDVIGRGSHCDIYIGGNQLIGGNTIAKNESTGNKKKYGGGTSGAKPLVWKSGFGIIKRVKITGSGSDNMLVA